MPGPAAPRRPHRARPGTLAGFTLTELAVVLIIVALLSGGLMVSLSTQQDIQQTQETRKTLETARDALLGFAASNGRLPCPAISTSSGREAPAPPGPAGAANCANDADNNYFLPAATLGLGPADQNGFLLDAWGNRVRYQVTPVADTGPNAWDWVFTRANGPKAAGMRNLTPDLEICLNSACSTKQATGVVAVLLSTGKNGAAAAVGPDELENRDGDKQFMSRLPGPDGAGSFDDQVIWLSGNTLYSKLMAAGQPLAAEPIP